MPAHRAKSLLAYLFVAYSLTLCVAVFWLSQYNWPDDESVKVVSVVKPDFREIADIDQRKQAFFAYLRPYIQSQNDRILGQREDLLALEQEWREKGKLSKKSAKRLRQLSKQYDVEQTDAQQQIEALFYRVNTIPEALALAQAASESAWGKSRFARVGNNYFGQWCFSEGCGIVPNRRGAGKTHEVAAFADTGASVAAYFHNLNTFHVYRELRQKRYQLTRENKPIDALSLIPMLGSYAEKGADYLDDLRAIIHQNALE